MKTEKIDTEIDKVANHAKEAVAKANAMAEKSRVALASEVGHAVREIQSTVARAAQETAQKVVRGAKELAGKVERRVEDKTKPGAQ